MYWYVATKASENQADAPIGRQRELQEMFQAWPSPIGELIAATDEGNILKSALYDRVPIEKWSFSNITLLEDAAHPTLPTMGQGACMAIEDALVLTQCLRQQGDSVKAFHQYECLRVARTKKIVKQSLLIGQVAKSENRVIVALRNTLMKLLTQQFENDYKVLHAYRA